MPINRRLLRTPRPHFDENLKGLIVRATEENGYDSPSLPYSLANLRESDKMKQSLVTDHKWQRLSEMLNLDISTLQDLACMLGIQEASSKFSSMFGHVIYKYSVRISEPKICPGCLRQSNHIRKIWDLAAFTCCPEHGTLLMNECPTCGKGIPWSRGKVSVCTCGKDWRDLFPPEVHESEKTLSRLILKVCGLSKSEKSSADVIGEGTIGEGDTTCNPVGTVSLGELLSAVYFISGLQNGVIDTTGKYYGVKLTHKELHEVLTKAIVVFEDWPNNYYKFIEESRGKFSMGSGQSGLYKDFGRLYEPLFIRKNNPLPNFMREEFKKYITTYWDGGHASMCRSISDESLSTKTHMTKHEAARHLQVGVMTVNLLHKKGFLRGPFYPWINRSRMMIEADSMRELKDRWDKSITSAEAGALLGIGRIAVVSLVKSGCLIAVQGPSVTKQLEWKFEVAEVERLLQDIEGKFNKGKRSDGIRQVAFHKAIQKLSKLRIEVGAFVKLILDGKITPAGKGVGTGLAAVLFDAGEIGQFSKAETVKRREGKHTKQEMTRLLRTSNDEISFLIKCGLLIGEKTVAGRGIWSITQEEVDRFKATYCTVGQMAPVFCTSTRGLSDRLMANGIMPVTGPKIDGGNINYFKRTDLEAVDIATILPRTKASTLQKMNEQGFVSRKQLSDITGYHPETIKEIIYKRKIIPAVKYRSEGGTKASWFFSQEQIEMFKKMKTEEEDKIALLKSVKRGGRAAA